MKVVDQFINAQQTQKIISKVNSFFLEYKYWVIKMKGRVSIPSQPMLGLIEQECLRELSVSSQTFIEYGSGGSTKYIASFTRHLITVESDKIFLATVKSSNLDKVNIDYLHANLGPTKSFGQPYNFLKFLMKYRWAAYAHTPWNFLSDAPIVEAIFIDGRFRVHCFLTTVLRNKAQEYEILVDDYFKRSEYYILEEIAGKPERIGDGALFSVNVKDLNLIRAKELEEIYKYDMR